MGIHSAITWEIWLFLLLNLTHSSRGSTFWPKGTYALPKPVTGCPKDDDSWKSGYVYHNTEDENNINERSNPFHGQGLFSEQGIEQSFCIKTNSQVNDSATWPNGTYCIYKYGGECPNNFKEGSIHWQDEKSVKEVPNHSNGILPDGEYDFSNTLIKFCCTNSSSPGLPIILPTETPFYLFPYKSFECQLVEGMNVTQEWIVFDDNDEGNTDAIQGEVPYGTDPLKDFNIRLYMCYYSESNLKTFIKRDHNIELQTNDSFSLIGRKNVRQKVTVGALAIVGVAALGSMIGIMVTKAQSIKALLAKIGKGAD